MSSDQTASVELADLVMDELIEVLEDAGHPLPGELRERFLAAGVAVVPVLINILDQALQGEPGGEGWAEVHAAELLGELGDRRAVPVLLSGLAQCEPLDGLYEVVSEALLKLGDPILEPCLERYAATTDERLRDSIAGILSQLPSKDERIYALLVETMERTPDLGAMCLDDYGDPRALPVLSRKFDELPLQTGGLLANQVFIELRVVIEGFGGELTEAQQRKYQQAERLRSQAAAALRGGSGPARRSTADWPPPVHSSAPAPVPAARRHKWGRNEPCWCGSGKKYKKCHFLLER